MTKQDIIITNEDSIELKDKGINIYIIHIKNRYFKGISKCHPNDQKNYSAHLGGTIAYLRACKKYYKYCIARLKDEELKEIYIKKLKEIPNAIENNIKHYYMAKERTKAYLERKEKGILNMRDQIQDQVNKLLELKEKTLKGEKNE